MEPSPKGKTPHALRLIICELLELRTPHSAIGSAGRARVTINTCASFFMAVHTPLHIVSVHHLHRPLFHTCETVTDGTIHTALNVNPVRKDDMSWKFIHPLPRDLPACLHILNNFQRLRSLAHCIGGVASATEFDVGYSCGTIPFNIPMT